MWSTEFDASEFPVPDEILAAVATGELFDISWHNDVSPSFAAPLPAELVGPDHVYDGGSVLRLWVDALDASRRELGGDRFGVDLCCQSGAQVFNGRYYSGDSAIEALAALRSIANLLRRCAQIPEVAQVMRKDFGLVE